MRIAAGVLIFAVALSAAAQSKEPFTSFRFIDRELSILNDGSSRLKAQRKGDARTKDLRDMHMALLRIQQRCRTLEQLYRKRGERYGLKAFRGLSQQATAASRAIVAVQGNQPGAEEQLANSTLALVMRYQALSSNYGENRCGRGQSACCEPKLDPETNKGPGEGCRWMCVSRARSCSGFLGPRTLK